MQERQCLELLDICYRTLEAPGDWQVFVTALTEALDSDAGDFVVEDYASGVALPLGSTGFDPVFRVSYDAEFMGENLWIEPLKARPLRRAFDNSTEPEGFERSPYYNEWVRPQGFRHALGGLVAADAERAIHLGVLRRRDRTPFGADETRLLDLLLPHVHRAIELGERLSAAGGTDLALASLVDQLRVPALLLGPEARVLHCNAPAEEFARRGGELRIRRGRLELVQHAAHRALRAAMRAAATLEALASDGPRSEIPLPAGDGSGRDLVLDVIPLRQTADVECRCLVMLSGPGWTLPRHSALLARLWDLTPTETDLALALAAGVPLSAYAARTGKSAGTARWHLKNVEAKLGVSSIAGLAAQVQGALRRP